MRFYDSLVPLCLWGYWLSPRSSLWSFKLFLVGLYYACRPVYYYFFFQYVTRKSKILAPYSYTHVYSLIVFDIILWRGNFTGRKKTEIIPICIYICLFYLHCYTAVFHIFVLIFHVKINKNVCFISARWSWIKKKKANTIDERFEI